MDARDRLWRLLETLKYKEHYIDEYNQRVANIETILSLLTMGASLSSIAAWSIWQQYPGLWSALIMVSQVVQLVQPKLPYSRRMTGIKFLLPHLRDLIHDTELLWVQLETTVFNDIEVNNKIIQYRRKCTNLEETYLGEDMLPFKKRLNSKAIAKTISYFTRNYGAVAE